MHGTAADTKIEQCCGWAALPYHGSHGPYKITTVAAVLRASRLFAFDLMDGATNGRRFQAYVADVVVPAFRSGDTAVIDNLAARETGSIRRLIEPAGANLLYLPPYSSDFNSIESAFAKQKVLLRRAAAQIVPDLWTALGEASNYSKSEECQNYLAAAGYRACDPI